MPRFKTALRFITAAAFAVPALLGLLQFCTFTFSGGGITETFSLSPIDMITGKTAGFSDGVLASSPLLGASFFIIPLVGLICCLISNADTRASITGVTALVGFAYIFFATDFIIPASVYYGKPLEQVYAEHMSLDSVIYNRTMAGNIMWFFYLVALVCSLAAFVVFMREMRLSAQNAYDEYYPEEEEWQEGDETDFGEIDETQPQDYGEDGEWEAYDEAQPEEASEDEEPEESEAEVESDEECEEPRETEEPEEKDNAETPAESTDNAEGENTAEEDDDSLIIAETTEAHETDINFKKLNFNRKKTLNPPKPSPAQTKATDEHEVQSAPAFFADDDSAAPNTKGICPKCGAKLRKGNVFCKKCGARTDIPQE